MTTQPISFETRIAQYISLRAKIKEMKDRHKAELAPYNDVQEKLEAVLQAALLQTGQESAKTAAGTVYLTTKRSASLEAPEDFLQYVIDSQRWELLDRKANVTAVADYLAEQKALPPGVKYTESVEVGVRAPSAPKK